MGCLAHLPLKEWFWAHNIQYLVETGAGDGASIAHVLTIPFIRIFSVECHPEIFSKVSQRFKDEIRVKIFQMDSVDFLKTVFSFIEDGPTCFWLDAHFPGADFGYAGYLDEPNLKRRLPLESELKLIAQHRKNHADIIIADDWNSIYHSQRFGYQGNREFVDLFKTTHSMTELDQDEGYLILRPKP